METPLQEEPNLPRFNGVAIELVRRGLKSITPLVPPELDGLSLPIGDLLQVLDYVPPKFAARMTDVTVSLSVSSRPARLWSPLKRKSRLVSLLPERWINSSGCLPAEKFPTFGSGQQRKEKIQARSHNIRKRSARISK
jgi:hypothetical protein